MLVSHRFPPDDIGGVECYTQRLAADLVKAGNTVSVVTRRWGSQPTEPETHRERLPDGTSLYRFAGGGTGLDRWYLNHFLLHQERLEQLFLMAMLEEDPDVVHFNHLVGLSPRFIRIAHRLRVPVVLSLHDLYFACPRVHLQKVSGELCEGPDGGRALPAGRARRLCRAPPGRQCRGYRPPGSAAGRGGGLPVVPQHGLVVVGSLPGMMRFLESVPQAPLSPVLGGEGLGVRGRNRRKAHPLTPTPLPPEYRGRGASGTDSKFDFCTFT